MKVTPELLEKYTQGICSVEEKQAVEEWLGNAQSEVSFPAEDDLSLHKAAIWDRVEEQAFSHEEEIKPRQLKLFWKPWLMAACVLLIFGVSFFLFERKIDNQAFPAKHVASIKYQTVRTAKGEKRRLKLSDGTEIHLNADSEIRFPARFDSTSRQVFLVGEAYFIVAKDKKRPFTVQTAQTRTRVLGTIFNLNAYSSNAATLVVKEGKVQFGNLSENGKPLILTANQRGRFTSESGLTKDNVYADRYIGWKEDRLLFDNESMSNIAQTLERSYDTDITGMPKRLADEHFTGAFDGKSLEYVLERLSYVMQFKYTIKAKTVTIY